MTDIPVDNEFDGRTIGHLRIDGELPNQHEYFLSPSYAYIPEEKSYKLLGYSFVHRSHLPTAEQLERREAELEAPELHSIDPKLTIKQKVLHFAGSCPRAKAGHPCSGRPGTCGW